MAKQACLLRSDGPRAAQMEPVRAHLAPYLAAFDLLDGTAPSADVKGQAADAIAFRYALTQAAAHASAAQGWNAYKDAQRDGLPAGASVQAPAPSSNPPPLPPSPPASSRASAPS